MAEERLTKVLIVDDMPEKLLVYEAILRDMDLELVVASSGEKALREVLHQDFAVILLDVNMPGMDGFETANLIRSRKKSAHTPIIFVTAYNDELRMAEGYSRGAVDFISTPIVPNILRAKVRVFVDLFRMTQQVRQHAQQEIALVAERAHRTAVEDANRRLSFLVKAGGVITRSLDRRIITESVLRLLVPEQADSAAVAFLQNAKWSLSLASIEHEEFQLRSELEASELPVNWTEALEKLSTGNSTDHESASELGLDLDPHFVFIPLRDRKSVFGALLAATTLSRPPFSPADLQLFESIASRAAIALTNAKLFEEIEFANQQKNRFLSMLAHELRNPLAPIQSAVDLMGLYGLANDDLNSAREVIDRQVSHMVRLVDDLLDVSRITLGKIRLESSLLDARDVVAAAVEISRPLISSQEHELQIELPESPVQIVGDSTRLSQVISNLLNNAAKYTPLSGTIRLSLEAGEREVFFRIRDTGEGIPPHMLDRVFDLFTQVETSASRVGGGLGVGLTLVRELVQLHEGRVEVTSAGAGQGSEFVVAIPRAADKGAIDEVLETDLPVPVTSGELAKNS